MSDVEPVDILLKDLAYLQDEAIGLQSVISAIPYDESPPGSSSVLEKIIEHQTIQKEYYAPLLERILFSADSTEEVSPDRFMDSRTFEKADGSGIKVLLQEMANQRSLLVNQLSQIDIKDWDRTCYIDDHRINIHELVSELVKKDRSLLKEIAEMVMAYQNEQFSRRQLKRNKSHKAGGE